MKNISLTVEYIRKNYAGFQIQPSVPTVQEALERALEKTFKQKIEITAAGRTDAGVHAYGQVINFFVDTTMDLGNMPKVININLPEDISIVGAKEVGPDFSARFSARSKTYKYVIYNNRYRSALRGDFSYCFPHHLDLDRMRQASRCLIGSHDFSSFMGRDSEVKDAVRTIYSIDIKRDGDLVEIVFHGKSFLRNMIRIIVGSLCDIGRGKLPVDFLDKALKEKTRAKAGYTAPAQGLFLLKVDY